jgi:phosphoribosylaminoimidazolecarboxamide formyltransferase / IMP cyclohydrolase
MTSNDKKTNRIKRALFSVSDKTGIVELARFLADEGVEIISTGGTKQALKDAGIRVVPVSSFTGAPEILDGRVKTLHPKIAAGILYRRDLPGHQEELDAQDYKAIDLVVVNLYPFAQTVARGGTADEIIENIDIGGPTMIRAAAKNFDAVTVLVQPSQYHPFIAEFKSTDGALTLDSRRQYAADAYRLIYEYDKAITEYFDRELVAESAGDFPPAVSLNLVKVAGLRYGENPHQSAALYRNLGDQSLSLVDAEQLAGKELSYNNYVDLDSVLGMIVDFDSPFACIVKHTNPCGAACADNLADAYRDALASDPMSAYGSIIGLNRRVDMSTAQLLHDTEFVECILAPDFEPDALALLQKKKQRRLLRLPQIGRIGTADRVFRSVFGGFLLQSADKQTMGESDLKVVTRIAPTVDQFKALRYGFRLVKHVKSNAIIIIDGTKLVGFGCGQTSRVDAVEQAVKKAGDRARGAVLASDAFFPMADGVEAAAAAGIAAIVQPGGSKRDEDAISAANNAGVAMVFTGMRHFRH